MSTTYKIECDSSVWSQTRSLPVLNTSPYYGADPQQVRLNTSPNPQNFPRAQPVVNKGAARSISVSKNHKNADMEKAQYWTQAGLDEVYQRDAAEIFTGNYLDRHQLFEKQSFIDAAREIYRMEHGEGALEGKTDREVAKWAYQYVACFNNNTVSTTRIANKFLAGVGTDKATDKQLLAFNFLMDAYDHTKTSGKDVLNMITQGIVGDPTTWASIGAGILSFGAGAVAGAAGKQAVLQTAKASIKATIGHLTKKVMANQLAKSTTKFLGSKTYKAAFVRGAVPGVLDAAWTNSLEQKVRMAEFESGGETFRRQEDWSWAQFGTSVAFGGVFGGGMGAGGRIFADWWGGDNPPWLRTWGAQKFGQLKDGVSTGFTTLRDAVNRGLTRADDFLYPNVIQPLYNMSIIRETFGPSNVAGFAHPVKAGIEIAGKKVKERFARVRRWFGGRASEPPPPPEVVTTKNGDVRLSVPGDGNEPVPGRVKQSWWLQTRAAAWLDSQKTWLKGWKMWIRHGPMWAKLHNTLLYWTRFAKYNQRSNLGNIAKHANAIRNVLSDNGVKGNLVKLDGKFLNLQNKGEAYQKALKTFNKLSLAAQKELDNLAALKNARAEFVAELDSVSAVIHTVKTEAEGFNRDVLEAITYAEQGFYSKEYKRRLYSILELGEDGEPTGRILGSDKTLIENLDQTQINLQKIREGLMGAPKDGIDFNQLNASNYVLDKIGDLERVLKKTGDDAERHASIKHQELTDALMAQKGFFGERAEDVMKVYQEFLDTYSNKHCDWGERKEFAKTIWDELLVSLRVHSVPPEKVDALKAAFEGEDFKACEEAIGNLGDTVLATICNMRDIGDAKIKKKDKVKISEVSYAEALSQTLANAKAAKDNVAISDSQWLQLEKSKLHELRGILEDIRKQNTPEAPTYSGALLQKHEDILKNDIFSQKDKTGKHYSPVLGDAYRNLEAMIKRFKQIDKDLMRGQIHGYSLYFRYWRDGYFWNGIMSGRPTNEIQRFRNLLGKSLYEELHRNMRFLIMAREMVRRNKVMGGDTILPDNIAKDRIQRVKDMVTAVRNSCNTPDELKFKMRLLADFIQERVRFVTMTYDVRRAFGFSQEFKAVLQSLRKEIKQDDGTIKYKYDPSIDEEVYKALEAAYNKQLATANVERLGGKAADHLFYYMHPDDRFSDFQNENEIAWLQKRAFNLKVVWKYLILGSDLDTTKIKESKEKMGAYQFETIFADKTSGLKRLRNVAKRWVLDPLITPFQLASHYHALGRAMWIWGSLGLPSWLFAEAAEYWWNDGEDYEGFVGWLSDIPENTFVKPGLWLLDQTAGRTYRWQARAIKWPINGVQWLHKTFSGKDYAYFGHGDNWWDVPFNTASRNIFNLYGAEGTYDLTHKRLAKMFPFQWDEYTFLTDSKKHIRAQKLEKLQEELGLINAGYGGDSVFEVEDGEIYVTKSDGTKAKATDEEVKAALEKSEEVQETITAGMNIIRFNPELEEQLKEKYGVIIKDGRFERSGGQVLSPLDALVPAREAIAWKENEAARKELKKKQRELNLKSGGDQNTSYNNTSPADQQKIKDLEKKLADAKAKLAGGNSSNSKRSGGGGSWSMDDIISPEIQAETVKNGTGLMDWAGEKLSDVWEGITHYSEEIPMLGMGLLALLFGWGTVKITGGSGWGKVLAVLVGIFAFSAGSVNLRNKDSAAQVGGGNHLLTSRDGTGAYQGGSYYPARRIDDSDAYLDIQDHNGGLKDTWLGIPEAEERWVSTDDDSDSDDSGDAGGLRQETAGLSRTYNRDTAMKEKFEDDLVDWEELVEWDINDDFAYAATQMHNPDSPHIAFDAIDEFNRESINDTNRLSTGTGNLPYDDIRMHNVVQVQRQGQDPEAPNMIRVIDNKNAMLTAPLDVVIASSAMGQSNDVPTGMDR